MKIYNYGVNNGSDIHVCHVNCCFRHKSKVEPISNIVESVTSCIDDATELYKRKALALKVYYWHLNFWLESENMDDLKKDVKTVADLLLKIDLDDGSVEFEFETIHNTMNMEIRNESKR